MSRRPVTTWLVTSGAAVVGALATAAALGPDLARRKLERRASLALSRDVRVGSVSLGWHQIIARDVKIAGAAPCEDAPLARVATVTLNFGDAAPWRRPREIVLDTVDFAPCRVKGASNLPRLPGAAAAGAPANLPRLFVQHLHVNGTLVGHDGRRWGLRTSDGEVTWDAKGLRTILRGASLDAAGWLSLDAREIAVSAEGADVAARLIGGAVRIAGGGWLWDGLSAEAKIARAGLAEALKGEVAPWPWVASAVRDVAVRTADGGPLLRVSTRPPRWHADLNVRDLPLAPLRPLVERRGFDLSQARTTFTASFRAKKADGKIDFEARGAISGLGVSHPALDGRPWSGLGASAKLVGGVDVGAGRVDVREGALDVLGLPLTVSGFLQRRDGARAGLRVATQTKGGVPCRDLLAQQPGPVRAALAGLELEGHVGLAAALDVEAGRWEDLKLDIDVSPLCDVKAEPDALAQWLAGPDGDPTTGDLPPGFVAFERFPKHLVDAFLTAEDGRFWIHRGFDPETIRRALAHDLAAGAFAKGASTITQQLAKNLFLTPERTLARKLEESIFTWRLEARASKKKILEHYLNIIEMGPEIRGVPRAARVYFGKDVKALTPLEAAHLAALTPNPLGFARRFRNGRVDDAWMLRLYELLMMMNRSGRLSAEDVETARGQTLALRKLKP